MALQRLVQPPLRLRHRADGKRPDFGGGPALQLERVGERYLRREQRIPREARRIPAVGDGHPATSVEAESLLELGRLAGHLYGRADRTHSDRHRNAGPRYDRLVLAARIDFPGQCPREDALHEQRARVAIDGRQLVDAHALLDVVNARCPVSRSHVRLLAPLQRELVIRLAPPRQHLGVVDPGAEQRVFLYRAAAARADESGEGPRMQPDFLEPVSVEIELLDLERSAAPQLAFG